jgi:GT2 family glycosyltransferase
LIAEVGAEISRPQPSAAPSALPGDLLLTAVSRRPLVLPRSTVEIALNRPVPVSGRPPPVRPGGTSIVIVTYEGLVFTRLCLQSLVANTMDPPYEVIVVDNGSRDDTPEYLATLAERNPQIRVILNGSNRGFAPACNEGLALARGDNLVLLNNDTMVPPGWLPRLISHLADSSIGLVGPVTNRIGNESEIEADYETWSEFLAFAGDRARAHSGEGIDIPAASMFCLAMRRDTYRQLGPLDERYLVGLLEDDDYSERARRAGYRVRCAEDVMVHHFGEASFGALVPTGEYGAILRENKRRYAAKWGSEWVPYGRRQSVRYSRLTHRVRDLVREHVPEGSRILVVSRGDDELLGFDGRVGLHFPQAADGVYAGHHPGDSHEAVAHLENVRRGGGAEFLLIPDTALWWLDHYAGLRRHLDAHYPRVADQHEVGVIYALQVKEEHRPEGRDRSEVAH